MNNTTPQAIGTTQLDLMNMVFDSIVKLGRDIENVRMGDDLDSHDCHASPMDGCPDCPVQLDGE